MDIFTSASLRIRLAGALSMAPTLVQRCNAKCRDQNTKQFWQGEAHLNDPDLYVSIRSLADGAPRQAPASGSQQHHARSVQLH